MPQFNVFGHPFDPHASALQGMVKHGNRWAAKAAAEGVHEIAKRTRDWSEEHRPSTKWLKLEDATKVDISGNYVGNGKRMPSKYSRGKRGYRRKKRVFRRKRKSFPKELWPRQKLVRLKSNCTGSLYTSAGAWDATNGIVIMKANSLNDPWAGEGAQLPLGLDQLAALYQRYTVVGCTIMIQCHFSALTGASRVGLALRNDNTSLANAEYYTELPLSVMKIASGDVDIVNLGMRYKAKRFWKVRRFKEADQLEGTFTTSPGDPSEVAYWHFWVQDLNANEATTLEYSATMVWDILLTDPVIPARSAL